MRHIDAPLERTIPDLQPGELAVLRSLDVLHDRGKWVTTAEIATAAGLQLRAAGSALAELRRRECAQARAGRWAINPRGIPHLSDHDREYLAAGRS